MKLTNILIASGLILLGATSVTAKQYPYLFVCQSCPRGTYGDGTTTSCTQCAAGTYSPGNATTCTKCRKGTSTNNQKG